MGFIDYENVFSSPEPQQRPELPSEPPSYPPDDTLDLIVEQLRARLECIEQELANAAITKGAATMTPTQELEDHLHNLYAKAAYQLFDSFRNYLKKTLSYQRFLTLAPATSFPGFVRIAQGITDVKIKQEVFEAADKFSKHISLPNMPSIPNRFWMQVGNLGSMNTCRRRRVHGSVKESAERVIEALKQRDTYLEDVNAVAYALAVYALGHAAELDKQAENVAKELAWLSASTWDALAAPPALL